MTGAMWVWLLVALQDHDLPGPAATVSFAEVVWQPLATRHAVTVLFGVSFLTCALGATLFGCKFRFPTTLRALDAVVRGAN